MSDLIKPRAQLGVYSIVLKLWMDPFEELCGNYCTTPYSSAQCCRVIFYPYFEFYTDRIIRATLDIYSQTFIIFIFVLITLGIFLLFYSSERLQIFQSNFGTKKEEDLDMRNVRCGQNYARCF